MKHKYFILLIFIFWLIINLIVFMFVPFNFLIFFELNAILGGLFCLPIIFYFLKGKILLQISLIFVPVLTGIVSAITLILYHLKNKNELIINILFLFILLFFLTGNVLFIIFLYKYFVKKTIDKKL